jgi:hypothetical protein
VSQATRATIRAHSQDDIVNLTYATIISPNYLAYARVLADSIARHEPGARLRVLLVDEPHVELGQAVAESGLDVVYATELPLPDFAWLAYKYDLVELNTALKPSFLKLLLAEGAQSVVYLDPDIRLYAPMEPVRQALERAQIVLVPHALAPVMDGSRPSDIDFLRTGTFNLGFVALRQGEQSRALLDWWEQRCLSFGFNDPSFGTFVDQKWLDLAPCYFDSVQVLKHRGCNVAYWNLHERPVTGTPGAYRAGPDPLLFFHFSGVDARNPGNLSRHQDRHVPQPGTALAELVADYCQALQAAGHGRWSRLRYSFAVLQDGTQITPLMRRAAAAGLDGSDPFDPASPLQQTLRRAGLAAPQPPTTAATTLNFDPSERRVRGVNAAVRLMARVIGASRVAALVRYATFLGWGGNLPALLLQQPFELRHRDARTPEGPGELGQRPRALHAAVNEVRLTRAPRAADPRRPSP